MSDTWQRVTRPFISFISFGQSRAFRLSLEQDSIRDLLRTVSSLLVRTFEQWRQLTSDLFWQQHTSSLCCLNCWFSSSWNPRIEGKRPSTTGHWSPNLRNFGDLTEWRHFWFSWWGQAKASRRRLPRDSVTNPTTKQRFYIYDIKLNQ